MFNDEEVQDAILEELNAMPDIATVLRRTPVQTPTGGTGGDFLPVPTQVVTPQVLALKPNIAPGTTPCRLNASVLGAGAEQEVAGQVVGLMPYTLTVPAGTNITPADKIRVPDGGGVRVFEVAAGKTIESWNTSDSWTLTELQH